MDQAGIRADLEAAKGRMTTKFGGRRELRKLSEYLWEDERVRLMATGTYGSGQGLLTLTDRRLVFIRDGVMSKTTEDFALAKISSVQWSSGLLLGKIIVFASGTKAEITNVDKTDGKAIVDAVRHLTSTSPIASQPTPVAPTETSVADQIRQLADLHAQGILTDEEFSAKKRQLLGL